MRNKKNVVLGVLGVLAVIFLVVLYGYSLEKKIISAVLQYQTSLDTPQNIVYAIVIKPQKLPNGQTLQTGTRLIGEVQRTDDNFEIYFHTVQLASGRKEKFSGKTTFNSAKSSNVGGISSKLGKTIHEQSRKSVLGAIFGTTESSSPSGLILQRGTNLLIETN